jgi:hypothetical protein
LISLSRLVSTIVKMRSQRRRLRSTLRANFSKEQLKDAERKVLRGQGKDDQDTKRR